MQPSTRSDPTPPRPEGAEPRYRIAMVAACPFPAPQGSQILIHQLSQHLSSRGHRVYLVTYPFGAATPDPAPSYQVLRTPPLPGYGRFAPGPSPAKLLLDCLLTSLLMRVVRSRRIDLIHAHHFEGAAAGYLVRATTGTPVIYHGHSGLEDELPTYLSASPARQLARRFGRWMDRQIPRRADALIAVSDEMRSHFLRSGASPDRSFTLLPGIDYPPGPDLDRAAVERKYGLPAGPKVLYAGNLAHYQSLPVLLRAFTAVVREVPDAHLIIASHDPRVADPSAWPQWVGPDSIPRDLPVSLIRDSGFDGIRSLLGIADVAVSLSSIQFGFPIKLLNYMAARKAVLAARVSAKGLAHLGNAFLTGTTEQEIAEGLIRLLRDPSLRARLGDGAARKVDEKHSWGALAGDIESLYEQVLRSRLVPPEAGRVET